MKTSAVASVLDPIQSSGNPAAWQTVEQIRAELEIPTRGVLHISWHIAEQYDSSSVKQILEKTVAKYRPFEVISSGIGVFTGEKPVLYLPVVKTLRMTQLHNDLWDELDPIALGSSPLYSPRLWMPHITLVYEESDPELVYRAARQLMSDPLKMEWIIDNFALIYRSEQAHGLLYSVPFGGAS
jgi:2'-5' RNA ligase